MEGFITAAFTALIIGCVYTYFKKTDNIKWLIARMVINIILSIFFLVGMIVMLSTIDNDNKWFSFFSLIPSIAFIVLLVLDLKRYDSLKEIERKKNQIRQKEMIEKQKAEKIANAKIATQKLLEQCGMKFFIKYYHQIKMIPLRDVEVEENYEPAERTERLQATKAIIDSGYSAIARDYILQNYVEILSEDEIQQLKSIL